jgi:hypothetical protein
MDNDLHFGTLIPIGAVVVYIWACVLVSSLAVRKGLDRAEHFIIAAFMSPVIGLLAVIAAMPDIRVLETRQIEAGRAKRCRSCREIASSKATVCPRCGDTGFEEPPGPSAPSRKFKNHEEWLAWKNAGSPPGDAQPPPKI